MNMIRSLTIGFIVAANILASVSAQQIWTTDACIRYAWDNNLSVRSQALGVSIQRTDLMQAGYNLLPEISAQASVNEYYGRSIDPATNAYIDVQFFDNSYGIYSTLELFSGFMKINTIQMKKYTWEAEKNKLEQLKNTVALQVINSYFDQLMKEGLVALARENFAVSRDQLNYTQRMVEVGRKAGTDLLELEANLAADSFLLVQSVHLLEQATLDLKYQMNFPVEDTLDIDTVLFSLLTTAMDTLKMEELFATASGVLPVIRQAENTLMAARKAVRVSQGNFSPRIGFYAGWSSNYGTTIRDADNQIIPFKDQISNNGSEYLSIGINIPLFSKLSRYTTLQKARLQYAQARISYDDARYSLRVGVEKSLTDWRSARAAYQAAVKQQLHQAKAFTAAEKKLEKGLINIIEFNIQKNNLFKAKTEVLRTGLQVLLKERYIRFLMTGGWIIEN